MKTTRKPAVIVVWHHSINGRKAIDDAAVWGWSGSDRGRGLDAPQTICGDAVGGDYIVWHDTYCEDGDTVRARPWSVVLARAYKSGRVEVAIGSRAISHHRRVEDAVAAARAMLRRDDRERDNAARAACSRNDQTACPDVHTCRHGIEG